MSLPVILVNVAGSRESLDSFTIPQKIRQEAATHKQLEQRVHASQHANNVR